MQEKLGWDLVDKSLLQSRIDNLERRSTKSGPSSAPVQRTVTTAPEDQQPLSLPPIKELTTEDLEAVITYAAVAVDFYDEVQKVADAKEVDQKADDAVDETFVVERKRTKKKMPKLQMDPQIELDFGITQSAGIEAEGAVSDRTSTGENKPPEAA